MPSDSKWRDQLRGKHDDSITGNRSYGNRSHYDDDDTVGMEYEESNFKNIIIAAAIAGGGIMGYKKGLFKYGVKAILERADQYKGYGNAVSKGIRAWTIKDSTAPASSIFRNKIPVSAVKTALDANYGGRMARDTVQDINSMKAAIRKQVTLARKAPDNKTYRDTDLMRKLAQITNVMDGLTGTNAARGKALAQRTFINDLIESASLTNEKAQLQLKRTGYRSATLGDLLEVNTVGGRLVPKIKSNKVNLEDKEGTLGRLKTFLNQSIQEGNPRATLLSTNKYKDLVLDPNIMISEAGHIIDVRHAGNSAKGFVRSLANDFHIPILGINPLRMFRVDEFVREETRPIYGLLHPTTMQPQLTGKAGRHTLSETFGDSPLLHVNGSTFKFSDDNKRLIKVAEHGFLEEIPKDAKTAWGLPSNINDARIQANLSFKDIPNDPNYRYTRADGTFKWLFGKMNETLNIGFQDVTIKRAYDKGLGIVSQTDPNTHIEAIFRSFGKRYKPFKDANAYNLYSVFGEVPDGQKLYVYYNKSKKFTDIFNPQSDTTMSNFMHQFVAGRGKDGEGLKNVTPLTSPLYSLFNNLNTGLSKIGLGLSNDDLGSAFSIAKNLVLKRYVPAYLAYQGYQYANYLTETDDGDTITKRAARGAVRLDLGWHSVKDTLGITAFAKKLSPMMDGAEQITQIPGLGFLKLDQTEQEREDYYKNGMDPMRKGRYWDLGNTAFTGGKTMYMQPNWYRRMMADVDFTQSKWGSRDEYWANSALPTLQHPFAPLRHFIFDKYHYEMKHYYDRPYLMSSPEGENIPMAGPVIGATLGRWIKPQIKMHKEYWNGDVALENPKGSKPKDYDIYETSGGSMAVVSVQGKDPKQINKELKEYSIKRVEGANTRADMSAEGGGGVELTREGDGSISETPTKLAHGEDTGDGDTGTGEAVDPDDVETSHNAGFVGGREWNTMSDVIGLRGFVARGLVTGESNTHRTVIDTPGYAYSTNRSFWDMNIGGLGGGLSEISRRFIQRRDPNTKYFNPVRNTQPGWMPGKEYFTDFQHGDPYMAVPKGEMRIAGEGYEKIWGIHNPLDFYLEADEVGKTAAEQQAHYLKQDTVLDPEEQKNRSASHTLARKIEAAWLKSGLAIDTRGTVDDNDNNIHGSYDARIKDISSDTGTAVAKIIALGGREYEKVIHSGMREQDKRAANFILHATKDGKGYIQYVNRDNPDEQKSMSLTYSEGLWKDTLKTVTEARNGLRKGLEKGDIKPADMYGPIDRYRILADVAPYSQEFQVAAAVVSKMKLSPEEEAEVKQIREGIKEAKKPMRIYPYKFKTSNVLYKDVVVKRVIDADNFIAEGMENNPIKLAGVHVIGDKSDKMFEEAQSAVTKYIHAGAHVRIGYTADDLNQVSGDMLHTVRAVVYSNGTNVNRALINHGWGKEKVKDWSPAGIHARFSPGQIAFGKVWETISHLDTPINTKFLQVRSAKESYERREVYGKDFQSWTHPIKDFLVPMVQQNIHRPAGLIVGTWIGAMFGRTAYGKIVGATVGFTTIAIGKGYASYYEAKHGGKWVPQRRRKDRELNEYMDILQYVKNRRLYALYAERAKKKYGIDVQKMIDQEATQGDKRKQQVEKLQKVKHDIRLNEKSDKHITSRRVIDKLNNINPFSDKGIVAKKTEEEIKDKVAGTLDLFERLTGEDNASMAHRIIKKSGIKLKYYTGKETTVKEIKRAINKEINESSQYRSIMQQKPEVTKALYYHNKAEETMYGYDPGEPMQNIMRALPKKERDYMAYFMKAPEEERKQILEMAPSYLRRPLESLWGMPVEDKPRLDKYFQTHQLPGLDWKGWDENADLKDVKVKMIKHESREFAEFNIWPNDIDHANQSGPMPLPHVNFRTDAHEVRNKLMDILHSLGMEDVNITIGHTPKNVGVNMNIRKDKRSDIEEQLNNLSL